MANYTKATLSRVGKMMNAGEPTDPPALVKLAKSGAFGRKAIYNWTLPDSDPQHRRMPRIAKRMVAMLAYFSAAGLLNDKRLEDIMALETTFENEKETAMLLRRMKRTIGVKGSASAVKAKAGAPDPASAEDDDFEDDGDAVPEATAAASTPRAA